MKDPRIHVYAVCKNEIDFLPHFFTYYNAIAERIIIYDNQSTDGSREFIESQNKGILRNFNSRGVLRDDIHRWIKNSVWAESRGIADWVIVSDLDELLYHHNLFQYLNSCRSSQVTIPKIMGFNMIFENELIKDVSIVEQAKYGAFSKRFSKNIIFDPNKIDEINYSPGGHSIDPQGDVNFGSYQGLKLLHYKYIGDAVRLQNKWNQVGKEISDINIKNAWGVERKNSEEFKRRLQYVKKNAELVVHDNSISLRRVINFLKRDRKPYI
jgi:hypothetical protein